MPDVTQISEAIEREAFISLHAHCPPDTRAALGLKLVEVEDAIAAMAQNDPSILINRTLGLGTKKPATAMSIAQIAKAYADQGVNNYFMHLYSQDLSDEAVQGLNDTGLEKARGWMKFHRAAELVDAAPTDLRVERVGRDNASDFGAIVCEAFGMTAAAIPMLAGLADDPRWYLYVSYDGEAAAGAGSLFVSGDSGWIEWGATRPEYRRRGSQAAIMSARLNKAHALGCSHIFTETGEAVDGDKQHSYGNILKRGFVETRLRQNFRPKAG